MTDGVVRVAVDGLGAKIDASELTVGANTVERQRVVLADDAGATAMASIFPAGFLRVTDEPRQIFYDPFDNVLNMTDQWAQPIGAGGATLPVTATGTMTMGTGTTAAGFAKLNSIASFRPVVPAWLGFSFALALPDGAAVTANSYRFWGCGTTPAAPTDTAPLTDAVGFEMTTAGHLVCVVYANGTRTAVADLFGGKQPTDASNHRYIVYVRTDRMYWYIDGIGGAQLAATSSFQSPAIQSLPVLLLAIAGATPPVSDTRIQCAGLAVWDTGKNGSQIVDGTYPWRKLQISAGGAAKVDGSGVVQPISAQVLLDHMDISRRILAQLQLMNLQLTHMSGVPVIDDPTAAISTFNN